MLNATPVMTRASGKRRGESTERYRGRRCGVGVGSYAYQGRLRLDAKDGQPGDAVALWRPLVRARCLLLTDEMATRILRNRQIAMTMEVYSEVPTAKTRSALNGGAGSSMASEWTL
jgi:hypothetical protein